jgi:hypothetical protein
LDTTGGLYLRTLRQWFADFPLSAPKQKRQLKRRLESFDNDTHRGVVNELAWWVFMQRLGVQAAPVPETSAPRPDFHVVTPAAFFVEVSTVNLSKRERAVFETGEISTVNPSMGARATFDADEDEDEDEDEDVGVPLDHADTCRRFVRKATEDKPPQMAYAAAQHQPCVLALFDYTVWGAFGTQFFHFLADFLLGNEQGFHGLPRMLSALVYVERKAFAGRMAVSRERSAIYYNPDATYPLDVGVFATLNQFGDQVVVVEPSSADPWIWL